MVARGLLRGHLGRYGAVLVVAAFDQVTKQYALATIFSPPKLVEVLPFLNFVPVWNNGISFGLLGDHGVYMPILLTIFALGVAALLPFVARNWDKISALGAVMMAGGALGNAIDRMIYGRVVDFIDVFAGQWHWPAFNVADIAVCTGAGLMFLAMVKESRDARKDGSAKGDGV